VAADTVVSAWLNYAGRNVICAGQPVVLQTTHYVRHAFQWFRDGVPTGQGRPELVAGESGWYKVRVTNCNGYAALSDSVQLVVTAPPRPDVQYASTLCYGDSLRLGNAAGMVVKWYRDDGALWAFDNHQAIAVTTSGTYHVTYTNEAGCTSRSAPIDLAVPQPHDMQIHPSGNGICPGEALQLTASTNAPHVRWSNGAQTKTIQVRRPGTYSVRAWEKPGCESWASIQVPELALPTVALGPDTSVCPAKGTPVIFRLDLGKGRYFLNESPVFTSLVRIYKPGVYTLRLVDGNGCTAQDTLRVDEVCEPEPLLIPNVITPNGDGLNDYFVVEGLYAPCELVVYNRWGKVVYRNEAYHNTWNGEGANAGVYYYTLRSTDATRRLWKGWIHVLR
jgi:gliding motility-associated-like protein